MNLIGEYRAASKSDYLTQGFDDDDSNDMDFGG